MIKLSTGRKRCIQFVIDCIQFIILACLYARALLYIYEKNEKKTGIKTTRATQKPSGRQVDQQKKRMKKRNH